MPQTIRKETPSSPNMIFIIMLIIGAFLIGRLWTQVEYMKGGGSLAKQVAQAPIAGDQGSPAPTAAAPNVDPVTDKDHLRGDKNSRIILVEYSDLECPFCKMFHPTAKQVVDAYPGKVAWVFRHFPLVQLHSKAPKEAEATECANQLGGHDAFWKLTDKIYEVTPGNNGLDLATLPDLAVQVGLDKAKFTECLDGGKMKANVDAQYQSGIKAGVNGTPGNILIDTKTGKMQVIPGAVPFEQLKQTIDQMLAS